MRTVDGIAVIDSTPLPGPSRQVQQTFTMKSPMAHVFASGRPLRVDLRPVREGATVMSAADGASLLMQPSVMSYSVLSELPNGIPPRLAYVDADEPVLRDWMQLPPGLAKEIEDTAREITRGASAPAQQAELIRDYLLSNFTYRIDPDPMPPNVEPVAHFLLVQQEGFCEIFASTMAVMLRTLHVPARVAVGYAEGEWDEPNDAFLVRQNMAHAWVEVYLPGFGWTAFDPTPPNYVPPTTKLPEENVGQGSWWAVMGRLALPVTLVSLGVVLLGVGFWPNLRRRRTATAGRHWGRTERLIFAAYRATLDWLAQLGLQRRRWETPGEFAARCRSRVTESALSALAPAFDDLTGLFVHARYATGSGDEAAARAVGARLTIQSVLRRERRAARSLRRRLARDGGA